MDLVFSAGIENENSNHLTNLDTERFIRQAFVHKIPLTRSMTFRSCGTGQHGTARSGWVGMVGVGLGLVGLGWTIINGCRGSSRLMKLW